MRNMGNEDRYYGGKFMIGNDLILQGRVLGGSLGSKSIGNEYFVDYVNGIDGGRGGNGKYPDRPYKTLDAAYALMSANKNDVLWVAPGASAYAQSAVLTFDKDYAHVIGWGPFLTTGGRARITNSVTSATAGETVISAVGSSFVNLNFQYGDSATNTSVIGISITGGRNNFTGCSFEGPIEATMGAAAYRVVQIGTGVQDCEFDYCHFGQRTILATGSAGATVYFTGANITNNTFRKCHFNAYNSNTASCTIGFASGAMPDSGWTVFEDCNFINNVAVNVADVIRFTSAAHGGVYLPGSKLMGLGTLVWATNLKTTIFTFGAAPAATGGVGTNP
jgi:hypothetical protein